MIGEKCADIRGQHLPPVDLAVISRYGYLRLHHRRCRFGRLCSGNRLSEDEGRTVLLLEAGGVDRNIFIHIPAGFFKTISNRA